MTHAICLHDKQALPFLLPLRLCNISQKNHVLLGLVKYYWHQHKIIAEVALLPWENYVFGSNLNERTA